MCPCSGIIGERVPIRLYLTVGMLFSGLFTCLFGLGYVYNIHNMAFYIFVQVRRSMYPCIYTGSHYSSLSSLILL